MPFRYSEKELKRLNEGKRPESWWQEIIWLIMAFLVVVACL